MPKGGGPNQGKRQLRSVRKGQITPATRIEHAFSGILTAHNEATRFKKDHFYPCRVATQFKKGNYQGYPSREAWSAAYQARQKYKRDNVKKRERMHDILDEAHNLQDMARSMVPKTLKVAEDIMNSENATDAAKLKAIELIWDRAYGKAPQTTINANIDANTKPAEVDSESLDRRISQTLNTIEKLTNRETEAPESEKRPANLRLYN